VQQLKKDYNNHKKKFAHWLTSVTEHKSTKDTHPVSMERNDSPADMPADFQWITETLEEKLQQCNDVIVWHNAFDKKYKECFQFIRLKEQHISKYYSDSFDPTEQMEMCIVSEWIHNEIFYA